MWKTPRVGVGVVDSESGSFGSSESERHIWKLLFSGRESIINLKEYMEKNRVNCVGVENENI